MKSSASLSSIGFHQSGSTSMTCPLRVPNLGFLPGVAFVRTRSATGLPLRQMVTRSPFSTLRINSGSLFFASATLTFTILSYSHVEWPCKVAASPRGEIGGGRWVGFLSVIVVLPSFETFQIPLIFDTPIFLCARSSRAQTAPTPVSTREIEAHTGVPIRCRIANIPAQAVVFRSIEIPNPPASRGTRPPPTGPVHILP